MVDCRGCLAEMQGDAVACRCEFQSLSGGECHSPFHFSPTERNEKAFVWAVENVDKELVATLRAHAPIMGCHESSARVIDGCAILFEPFSDGLEAVERQSGQVAIGFRPDVEQQIGILSGRTHQHLDECFGRFITVVGNGIAPMVVDGLARFQGQLPNALPRKSRLVFAREVALENLNILACIGCLMVVVADETLRLQLMNERILLGQLPIERLCVAVVVPPAIKPDGTHRPIVREQFGELRVHKSIIAGPVGFCLVASRAIARASLRIILASPV